MNLDIIIELNKEEACVTVLKKGGTLACDK